MNRGNTTIGSKYRKVLYRQYESDMFLKQIKRTTDEDMSLGLLGPAIHVQVGEEVRVHFKNMATRPYSIHPEGLYTTKLDEGAVYGSDEDSDSAVSPQQTRVYTWHVPASRAPADGDRACMESMYYSSVNRVSDTNSGLVGPLVICREGVLDGRCQIILFHSIPTVGTWGGGGSQRHLLALPQILLHKSNSLVFNRAVSCFFFSLWSLVHLLTPHL